MVEQITAFTMLLFLLFSPQKAPSWYAKCITSPMGLIKIQYTFIMRLSMNAFVAILRIQKLSAKQVSFEGTFLYHTLIPSMPFSVIGSETSTFHIFFTFIVLTVSRKASLVNTKLHFFKTQNLSSCIVLTRI